MLVEMLGRFVPTQAELGEIQPIVCINRSDTPAGLLQPLRNLFTDKAFATGIYPADANEDRPLARCVRSSGKDFGYYSIELMQARFDIHESTTLLGWCFHKLECRRIHTIAKPGWLGAIVEHMPEVRTAPGAGDLAAAAEA